MSAANSSIEDSRNERSFRYFEASEESDKKKQAIKKEKIDSSSNIKSASSTSTTISAVNFTAEDSSKERSLRYFETIISPAEVSSNLLVKKCEQNIGEHRKWYPSHPLVGWGEEDGGKKLVIKEEVVDTPSKVDAPPISAFSMTSTVPSSSAANPSTAASATQSDTSKDEKNVGDFKTIISPASVSTTKCRWNRIKECKLLKIYAKYKAQFSCSDVKEQTVWRRIVEEVREKTSLNCDESECRNKIDRLKCEYERIKNLPTLSWKKANFLDRRRKIFETTENPGITYGPVLKDKPKWTKAKEYKLLQVYDKYKAEFLCPDVKEQTVWRKIVEEFTKIVSLNFSELECRNKIDYLKWKYERMKNSSSGSRKMAKYLDKTKNIFGATENPVTVSVEQTHNLKLQECRKRTKNKQLQECGKRNKRYHYALLQVYAKYKTEFDSPDIKEQKVWKKIAREMQEVFSYNCGETLCRLDLLTMKQQYKGIKTGLRTGNMPYYFDEAWKAFETAANLEKVFTVRVDNLSKRVTERDLRDLFKRFGRIANIYMTKDASGLCGGTAYITFYRQEDAHQAIFTVNGYKYDNLILEVTWLENDTVRTLKSQLYQSSCHSQGNYGCHKRGKKNYKPQILHDTLQSQDSGNDDGDNLSINNASYQSTAFYGGEEKFSSKPCSSTEKFQSFTHQKTEGLRYFQRQPSHPSC